MTIHAINRYTNVRRRLTVLLVLLLTFFVPGMSFGQSGDEKPSPVRLGGPDILKLDWGTRALRVGDLNADNRPDIAVLNNNHARIDLIFHQSEDDREEEQPDSAYTRTLNRWEPTLTDAPFVKEPLVTGIRMFDLEIADLNDDGKQDLAYTGRPDDLTVRLQQENGGFPEKTVFDFPTPVSTKIDTLETTDVNGDGRTDLVALGKKQIFVYAQNDKNTLDRTHRYALVDPKCSGLRVLDLTQDNRVDLVYTAPVDRHPLRIRPGLSTGGFGPERMYDIQRPKNTVNPLALPEQDDPVLAYLQEQTEMITLLRFTKQIDREKQGLSSLKNLSPRVYSTGRDLSDGRYAIGDLDGNGHTDIVVVDPNKSEIIVFFQSDDGRLSEPEPFPAPNDLRSVTAADVNGNGRAELFMVSRGEGLLGVSRWKPPGRITFPSSIPVPGKPLAGTSLSRPGTHSAIAVLHVTDNKRMVSLLEPAGEGDENWSTYEQLELTGLHIDPVDVRAVDANRDGRRDLAVFAPGSPVRFLLQSPDGGLMDTRKGDDTSGSGLSEADPSRVHSSDLNGDDVPELLLAENNYLRSIEINEDGTMKVLDQYNAETSEARVTAGMVTDLDRDGTRDLLLLDERSGELQRLQKNEAGVFRFVEAVRFGDIDQVRTEVMDFDGDGTEDLLIFGKKKFWKIPVRRPEFQYDVQETWKMDVEDVTPSQISVGDLNGDGADDLVAMDTTDSRVLGVYTRNQKKKWLPSLFFKVFSSDPHYRGRKGSESEPRETAVVDVTGDQKEDVLLLVHNRILIYPQK